MNRLLTGLILAAMGPAAVAGAAEPALIAAARARDDAAVRVLLKTGGGDVDARATDGSTALTWAVHWDDQAMADALIRAGASVNAMNEYRVTPLALACTNGSAGMVSRLLAAKADPNAARANGETALMTCARSGNADAVRALLAAGAAANAAEPVRSQTALMWAAEQNHAAAVHALVEGGADIRARSSGGFTALLFAAKAGARDAVDALLARGANINEVVMAATPAGSTAMGTLGTLPPASGTTALLLAIISGHWDLAHWLLDRGADPNAGSAGYLPLHWAAGEWETDITGPYGASEYRWMAGVRPGKVELVRALVAHGANVNARVTAPPPRLAFTLGSALNPIGATPFILAAKAGSLEIMQALVSAGADPRLTTNDHTTALMTASGLGRVIGESNVTPEASAAVATYALQLGLDVNARNDAGETALHGAAYGGNDPVVRLLVDAGAPVNARNKSWGYTPLAIAERYTGRDTGDNTIIHDHTATLLRSLGGDDGIELEGKIIEILHACPAASVLVRPGPEPRGFGPRHVVLTTSATHFTAGGCADLEKGATVTLKGVRREDFSVSATEIAIRR